MYLGLNTIDIALRSGSESKYDCKSRLGVATQAATGWPSAHLECALRSVAPA